MFFKKKSVKIMNSGKISFLKALAILMFGAPPKYKVSNSWNVPFQNASIKSQSGDA